MGFEMQHKGPNEEHWTPFLYVCVFQIPQQSFAINNSRQLTQASTGFVVQMDELKDD